MKSWILYYNKNVINWDLLQKLPSINRRKKLSLVKFFPAIDKVVFKTKLKTSNDSDFRIIKMMTFLVDLVGDSNINILVEKETVKSSHNSGRGEKFVNINFVIRKHRLNFFLENLIVRYQHSLIKKQVPFSYGIDDKGIVKISVRDIGELGVFNLKYDYFGWQDTFTIFFYFKDSIYEINNLFFSYLNFKLIS